MILRPVFFMENLVAPYTLQGSTLAVALAVLAFAVLHVWGDRWTPMRIAGAVIGLPSFALLILARIQIGGSFSVRPKAHALVTHSSNVAIEAACLGTPVFVAPTSAAAPVGRVDLADIEMPIYPDREPWLAHLAYNQFSFEEIRSGEAWRMLLELEERDFV